MNNNINTNPVSSRLAKWVDDLSHKHPPTSSTPVHRRVGAGTGQFLINGVLLPFALTADATANVATATVKKVAELTTQDDEERRKIIEERLKAEEGARKSLRGILFTPTALAAPDAVSAHFLPKAEEDGKVHATGMLYAQKAIYKTPSTIEEIQALVIAAKANNQKIAIRGAGYSQGKQFLVSKESDIIINMRDMNSVTLNSEKKSVSVGGGATWEDIQKIANDHMLAVQVMQASNVFSVGGSVSANCHGWDHQKGSLGNTILSIKIVDSSGELKTLQPQDELFSYVVGGWGLFGIIVEVELQLTENLQLLDYSEMVKIEDYVDYFRIIQQNPQIKMHLFRLSLIPGKLLQEGFAQNYTASGEAVKSEDLNFESETGTLIDRIQFNVARHLSFAVEKYWENEKKQCCNHKKKSSRNDFMHPKINATFALNTRSQAEWLQEYFIPLEYLAEFIKFLGKVLDENEVELFNASVRYISQDNVAKMGYATSGEKFAIVLFFSQYLNPKEVEKTKKWIQEVVEEVIRCQGTFYIPYIHAPTKEQFQACYPQWEEIVRKKQEYDPNCIFSSGFYEEYLEIK